MIKTRARILFMMFLIVFASLVIAGDSYAAQLLTPANGSVVTTLTPELSWRADGADVIKYDVWILKKSKNYGFYLLSARLLRDASQASIKLREGMLQDNNDYLWMVRSVTAKSIIGTFSPSFKFSVKVKNTEPPASSTTTTTTTAGGTSVNLDTVSGLISAILQKFNITMENGTSQWTVANLKAIYNALARLPQKYLQCTRTIQKISSTPLGSGIAGYVNSGQPSKIYITDLGSNWDLVGTLVHEMAHCFQFNGNMGVMNQWFGKFWGSRNAYNGQMSYNSEPPTEYGKTNAYEDMAESVRLYYMSPGSLKSKSPERYAFVKQYIMANVEF